MGRDIESARFWFQVEHGVCQVSLAVRGPARGATLPTELLGLLDSGGDVVFRGWRS